MDLDRIASRLNPLVVGILRSPAHRLLSFGLLLLTVTGRRTGRRYTLPVGYQRDGRRLIVLVSRARRKQWWRNYEEPGPVEVRLGGRDLRGMAWRVHPDSFEFRKNLERTFRRLPWLGRSFGIHYDRRIGLREEQIAYLAREAAMVQIELERPDGSTRDALGLVTGGLAHDANNALYVILGRTELALQRPDAGPAVKRDLEEILAATRRAVEILGRLREWNAGRHGEESPVDVEQIVREVVPLLRASLVAPPPIVITAGPGDHRVTTSAGDLARVVTHVLQTAAATLDARRDGSDVADESITVDVDRVDSPPPGPRAGAESGLPRVRLTVRVGSRERGEIAAEVAWPALDPPPGDASSGPSESRSDR